MNSMGRHRKSGSRLPKYVYRKRGWYVWRRDMLGQGAPVRLVRVDAPMSEVWAAWEAVQRDDVDTLSGLLKDYIAAADIKTRTRKDYQAMARLICAQRLADGRTIGEANLTDPTPVFWRHYLDKMKDTPYGANRRFQLVKAAYAWAYERGRVPSNPCTGVRLLKEASRDRYVTDAEYDAVLALAKEWAQAGRRPYLWIMMELAYLCRARRSEVCDMRRQDIDGDRLYWKRRKGSRAEYTVITPRLRAAIEAGKRLDSDIASQWLVHIRGQQIKKSAFDSSWNTFMKEVMPLDDRGNPAATALVEERFTFHDLKAKGVSDHKAHYSGHKSESQRGVYIRKPDEIEATR